MPLLFEAGIEGIFDATIAVVSEEQTRARRAGDRGQPGLGGREARQLTQEEKAGRADHVVRNEGTLEELEQAMREVLESLTRGDKR